MKIYGLEPDLCINNPDWITNSSNDIVLPKYFYVQLEHLKNGEFGESTNASHCILESLERQEQFNLLIFQNSFGKKVFFLDQEVAFKFASSSVSIDVTVPVNRYLVTLFLFAGLLKSKINFFAVSPEIIQQCQRLNFELVDSDSFLIPSKSWLKPKLIKDIQVRLDPLGQIQWEEDANESTEQIDSIKWIDFRR